MPLFIPFSATVAVLRTDSDIRIFAHLFGSDPVLWLVRYRPILNLER